MSRLPESITATNFSFTGQTNKYVGKVRDVYTVDDKLIMVATDRISAFDHVLPRGIPYKGQVLNQIAAHFLKATEDIVPNWVQAVPDPMVTIGKKCDPFKVEMVIRGYLTGHAWRTYKSGGRNLCGEKLPDGLVEHQKLPEPIITPTTKADKGHDEDISAKEIISNHIVSQSDYNQLAEYTFALFERGTEMAAKQGLILVDTKYEFGKDRDGKIILIDEIHTPDSSRYFYASDYSERLSNGQQQRQLSKEFVREWLMEHGFQGKDGQAMPEMTDEFVSKTSDRYIELYEKITGHKFEKQTDPNGVLDRIENNIKTYL